MTTTRRSLRRRFSRRFSGFFTILVALVLSSSGLVPAPEAFAAQDFDPRDGAWNGMNYLLRTAAEARVDIELRDTLDFSDLDPRTILMLVAPQVGPDARLPSLRAYLKAGGRLIVADDFRAGYKWLKPLGIEVQTRAGPAEDHVEELRHLPRFGLRELGPYLNFYDRTVSKNAEIVLNHPASLTLSDTVAPGVRGAIRGWFGDHARGWLAELAGKERVLALADSSVLINAMLRGFYGNKQLAANVMRYFCYVGEPCRVRLVSNLNAVEGTFDPTRWERAPGGLKSRDPRARLRHYAGQLSELLQWRQLTPLWWLLVLLAVVTPPILASRTPRPLLPPQTSDARGRTRLHETVAAWLAVADADYRQPARLLAGHLASLVQAAALQANGADSKSPRTHDLPRSIDALVGSGRLSGLAARRINDIVTALREVAGGQQTEIDRQRFTALAAEVEWAEDVLNHTSSLPKIGGGPHLPRDARSETIDLGGPA